MIIEVNQVRRSFRSVVKEAGLKGSLKLLVNPQYQEHHALKGISFEIESGSFVGLIGANGAGKTTLLKILSGLIPPTSGQAKVLGYTPFKRNIQFRKKIALVMGQKAQLWWDLPAIDAFDLLRAIYEIPSRIYRERLNHLADLLDVKAHLQTQIRRLSLGERMKMELIGAILHWPSVIFLDEPTIGLDVFASHKLREFLKVFNQEQKATILLTSHNMDDIERLCSRVLIIRSGELIYDGKPAGLTQKGEQRLRVRFFEKPSSEALARVTGLSSSAIEESSTALEEEEDKGSGLVYFTTKKDQIVPTLQRLMTQFQIVDMGIEEQSLERVIQKLFESDKSLDQSEEAKIL